MPQENVFIYFYFYLSAMDNLLNDKLIIYVPWRQKSLKFRIGLIPHKEHQMKKNYYLKLLTGNTKGVSGEGNSSETLSLFVPL
jgi:hypothetical protein